LTVKIDLHIEKSNGRLDKTQEFCHDLHRSSPVFRGNSAIFSRSRQPRPPQKRRKHIKNDWLNASPDFSLSAKMELESRPERGATTAADAEGLRLLPSDLLALYRRMRLIRLCEERLVKSHQQGLVHGACHTSIGQEAVAAGVCANLWPDDVVFSTHRGHGHALAKGLEPRQLLAELYGRQTGCSRGRGGSMHLFAPEIGLLGTSGIVGPCMLQAVGAGYSFRLLKAGRVAVAFLAMARSTTAPSTKP
jgi:hypothetical protein